MTVRTKRSAMQFKVLVAVGLCVALLGGIAAWLVLGRDTAAPCNGLPEDETVRKSLGAAVQPGMSCAAFGDAVVKATVGAEPGVHSQQQAQVLKDVLFALGFTQPDDFTLDPALRLPLATALADYAPDVHEMLAALDSEYMDRDGRSDPPWESGGTYHVSVFNTFFRDIVRAISEDPRAYTLLRTAESRHVAQELAAVPSDAKDLALSLPPRKSARVLGVLDGIASVVMDRLDKDEARAWRAAVVEGVARGLAAPGEGENGPGDSLTTVWLGVFESTRVEERFDHLSTQGVDLARIWLESRNTDEATQQGVLAEVANSALGGSREVAP
ncbi:hypothetical protein Q5762_34915 [Streptomyces sp. P9(2023)]|uniref:hypothetical protein n=1 Tax=Streptomyces sp. P9(2023) TaxID=3064394 RepID=UPI0028F3F57B|nr:hypothetical protein [Streptomyces sp. P9(2023)]MDT9693429.1 hypothetical protein [Streptomyces sp. P9(2023)]